MNYQQGIAALLAAGAIGIASAAVVTSPVGIYTNAGGSNAGDPPAQDVWLRTNVRNGGAVGISNNYPRNGTGSVYLSLGANTGNNGKADWEFYPATTFGRLADLGSLNYDWYRDAASTAPNHLHPVLRLMIDADGNPATTNDRGYLVFERCYNVASCPAVPTNAWTSESITGSTNLWWTQFGVGTETVFNRNLNTYKAGSYTPTSGFAQIGPNSVILGVSMGIGSGWNTGAAAPAFNGAIDNLTITTTTQGAASLTNTNFELVRVADAPAVVPTLSASLLVALAATLGLVGGWRRRRGNG